MAKEIVIWCDPCLAEDVRTPSREYRLAVGTVTKTVDLCDAHADQFVKPVSTLLEEYGATVEVATAKKITQKRHAAGSNRSTGPLPEVTLLTFQQTGVRKGKTPEGDREAQCLWCPMDYSVDGSGFRRHLETAHGLTGGFLKIFGGVPCPVCGKTGFTSLGAHLTRSHPEADFKSQTQAFIWARDNGDPHGSYATVLAKAPILA